MSEMKGLPVQQDGINCTVYSLWYLLASNEDMLIIELNPERIQDQLHCIQFACTFSNFVFEVNLTHCPSHSKYLNFKKKTFKKNSKIHEIMTIFLDQKQTTKASTITYAFEEWSVLFKKAYKNPKIFYFQTELSDKIYINFPLVLNNLVYVHNLKIILQVHWN